MSAALSPELIARALRAAAEVLSSHSSNTAAEPVAPVSCEPSPPEHTAPEPETEPAPANVRDPVADLEAFRSVAVGWISSAADEAETQRRQKFLADMVRSYGADRASELSPADLAAALDAVRKVVADG